ncbi:hypothetical protein D9M71_787860 [compost metagenome]
MLGLDFFAQALQGLGIIDVQLAPLEAGRFQPCDVFGFAGRGPDLVAGALEAVGQGAADAAGTTGDEDEGHEANLMIGEGASIIR